MSVRFPDGYTLEKLGKAHQRTRFDCGTEEVNTWLRINARQSQQKHLSVTRVLITPGNSIAGYYTLAIGQVNMDALPHKYARNLPRTMLPIITLAWLGVDKDHQGSGLGKRLLASALQDCFHTGKKIPSVAVLLDCLNKKVKEFYQHFDFQEMPGYPMKLVLPWKLLEEMME
ncbi:MAG: GNAT family N-acetyltransferase [Planctomycetota bacterium]|nr:GNAT family N-acetyltransferase [Planctomycetota bacterium]